MNFWIEDVMVCHGPTLQMVIEFKFADTLCEHYIVQAVVHHQPKPKSCYAED